MKTLIQIVTLGVLLSTATPVLAAPATVYKGAARFIVKPEHVEEFKAAVAKIIGPTRGEPANISYEAYQVVKDGRLTNQFEFHELWKSKEAMMIDHKENSRHMQEFFKTIRLDSPDSLIETFEVDGHEVIGL